MKEITLLFILLEISDQGWIAIASIAASFFSLISVIAIAIINRKVNVVSKSIDGLLEQKSKADKALGAKEEKDTRERQDASENIGKLKVYQQNKDAVTEVKEIKEVIVKTVETKADETQEVVKKIPEEVVKKLPPKE